MSDLSLKIEQLRELNESMVESMQCDDDAQWNKLVEKVSRLKVIFHYIWISVFGTERITESFLIGSLTLSLRRIYKMSTKTTFWIPLCKALSSLKIIPRVSLKESTILLALQNNQLSYSIRVKKWHRI